MSIRPHSNIIGIDDAPFDRAGRERVPVVGAVFAGLRFDGVLVGDVEKDGADAAERIGDMIYNSRFREHIRLVLLQGIALGGFNVVDVFALVRRLEIPVLVVSRKNPGMDAIREALLTRIAGGAEKWGIIDRLGEMEPVGGIFVQRVGISREAAARVIERFAIHGRIPEPIRAAHMIATAMATGHSRGNP